MAGVPHRHRRPRLNPRPAAPASAAAVDIGTMFGASGVTTFLGFDPSPTTGLADRGAAAVVLGADTASPYATVGAYCAGGPAAIRRAMAGYAANRGHVDFDLGEPLLPPGSVAFDAGDVPVGTDGAANRRAIQDACAAILAAGAVPVLLGGDDSVPIPLLHALAERGPFAVVQVDAHIDWRDEVQGERFGLSSNMRRASELDAVHTMVQIGQRALGSARTNDRDDAIAAGVHFLPARTMAREGRRALADAVSHIPAGADVYLNVDIDGLDPSIAPGVIGAAPGGLGYWDVVELLTLLTGRGRLAAWSVTEFMPTRDVNDATALVAGRLAAHAIAVAARQRG